MLRSMFAAITGMRTHQTRLDVTANNIANVNTTGFKSGRANFQDVLSQTVRGASSPGSQLGSVNPMQVGLGTIVGGIDVVQTQGNLQSTGKITDLAIQGEGFFVLRVGDRNLFTRDGSFDVGVDGTLVQTANGFRVMGWQADADGNVDTNSPLSAISVPVGQRLAATPSAATVMRGNLNADVAVGETVSTSFAIYDSLGVRHTVRVEFEKTAANEWSWTATPDPDDTTVTSLTQTPSPGQALFTGSGSFDPTSPAASIDLVYNNGADNQTVDIDMSLLTQNAGESGLSSVSDGFGSGDLVTFAIGEGGQLTGIFSNGQTRTIAQLATAIFVNPGGLMRAGANSFEISSASGEPIYGTPATGGRGRVTTGALEMSNVDLAVEFTNMIGAQRGFQANARVISKSDEVLQELTNLGR